MDTVRVKLEEFQISSVYEGKKKRKTKRAKLSNDEEIKIVNMDAVNLEIDFIGLHCSIINAFRRIVLAEVPTMAIEKVYMYNNTSIVQDEVLSHRLGLIPLNVDPNFFEFKSKEDSEWNAQDSVKYKLNIRCKKKEKVSENEQNDVSENEMNKVYKNEKHPSNLYKDRNVYSSSLKWDPIGNQVDIFSSSANGPLHDNILLAKLNPGHEINLEAYAVKGIGSDHAKFQPCLCWYRMLPEITLLREVEGSDAELLQKCFSPGVINVEISKKGKKVAKVADARYDDCSRNVFQYDSIKNSVSLTRKTDHIIFYIESHSALRSHVILEDAITIMINKCNTLLKELKKYEESI